MRNSSLSAFETADLNSDKALIYESLRIDGLSRSCMFGDEDEVLMSGDSIVERRKSAYHSFLPSLLVGRETPNKRTSCATKTAIISNRQYTSS